MGCNAAFPRIAMHIDSLNKLGFFFFFFERRIILLIQINNTFDGNTGSN